MLAVLEVILDPVWCCVKIFVGNWSALILKILFLYMYCILLTDVDSVTYIFQGGGVARQASSSTSSALQTRGIFSLILSPFIFIWNFLYSLLFGGGSSGSQPERSSQPAASSQPYTRVNRPSSLVDLYYFKLKLSRQYKCNKCVI